MRILVCLAVVALVPLPALAQSAEPCELVRDHGRTVLRCERPIEIVGRVPRLFTVETRSAINWTPADPRRTFVPSVVDPVRRAPF